MSVQALNELIQKSQHILIMQADNPDGDSMGSALALEQILGDMGKQVSLYCGVAVPTYLRHLAGWDRINDEIPQGFDCSIIVDTSADSLFENLRTSGQRPWVASKPSVVIDHHPVDCSIDYATIVLQRPTAKRQPAFCEGGVSRARLCLRTHRA